MWTAARTIEGGWRFCGPELLGLVPNDSGQVPLAFATFIDYQFSALMVQDVLLPLKESVLKRLHDLTHTNSSGSWFALFIVNFILLHTYSLLLKQQRTWAQRRKAEVRPRPHRFPFWRLFWADPLRQVRYTMMPLVRGAHHGAKTLLAHFHLICKGQKPFEIDWNGDRLARTTQRMAKVSIAEAEWLHTMTQLVRQKGE